MKKGFTFFSLMIAFALVVSVFSPAMAKPLPPNYTLPDPTVTWLTGDSVYTTLLLTAVQLPGSSGADDYLPVGNWPSGEKLFAGMGIALSNYSYGSVSLCFPFNPISQGWTYAVGVFDGSGWNLLPTTINSKPETLFSTACATGFANGTYALLKWWGQSSTALQACGFNVGIVGLEGYSAGEDEDYIYLVITGMALYSRHDLTGDFVTVTFDGVFQGDPVTGILTPSAPDIYLFLNEIPIQAVKDGNFNDLIVNLQFDTCQVDADIFLN